MFAIIVVTVFNSVVWGISWNIVENSFLTVLLSRLKWLNWDAANWHTVYFLIFQIQFPCHFPNHPTSSTNFVTCFTLPTLNPPVLITIWHSSCFISIYFVLFKFYHANIKGKASHTSWSKTTICRLCVSSATMFSISRTYLTCSRHYAS